MKLSLLSEHSIVALIIRTGDMIFDNLVLLDLLQYAPILKTLFDSDKDKYYAYYFYLYLLIIFELNESSSIDMPSIRDAP